MAGTTITSSTTIGIDLTLTSQNPVLIETAGTVAVTGADFRRDLWNIWRAGNRYQ